MPGPTRSPSIRAGRAGRARGRPSATIAAPAPPRERAGRARARDRDAAASAPAEPVTEAPAAAEPAPGLLAGRPAPGVGPPGLVASVDFAAPGQRRAAPGHLGRIPARVDPAAEHAPALGARRRAPARTAAARGPPGCPRWPRPAVRRHRRALAARPRGRAPRRPAARGRARRGRVRPAPARPGPARRGRGRRARCPRSGPTAPAERPSRPTRRTRTRGRHPPGPGPDVPAANGPACPNDPAGPLPAGRLSSMPLAC